MIKVCFVIGQLNRAGAERQLYELVKGINKDIFCPIVISLSQGGYWAEEIRKLSIEIIEIPRNKNKEIMRLFRLMKILKLIKPDIIHTYLFSANSYGRVAAILNRVPIIIACERNLPEIGKDKSIYQLLVDKVLALFSDGIICNSLMASESLVKKYSFNSKKVFTVHNGFDANDFFKKGHVKKPKNIHKIVVGTVGRLWPQKNHRLFLDAARIVLSRHHNKDIEFILVGDGPLKEELKNYSVEIGIEKKVIFSGEQENIPHFLELMDIFVMTSLYEGLSNAIMEAMAAELPVVATDVGGNRELIVDGKTGFLCPMDDSRTLAEKVSILMNDEKEAARMGANGRLKIENEFDLGKMVHETEEIYLKLLKQNNVTSKTISHMNPIAYITAGTPLSKGETFILTEMLTLKELGVNLLVLPRDSRGKVFHKGAEPLLNITLNIPWFSFNIVRQLIGYLATQPVSFIKILYTIAFEARDVKIAVKNIVILPKSLYLAAILKRSSVSHIHAHWASTTATMAYIISTVTQIPWSFTAHRWDIRENNILKEKCKKASFVRTISEAGRAEILHLIKDVSLADKITVIHMGVVVPESPMAASRLTTVFTILCPANFVEVKGHKYLIEGCNILKKKGIKINCILAGDGPLEENIKTYVKNLNLGDIVQFEGRLAHETILGLYERQEIHAVVLPSIVTSDGEKEGIPVALMEAMSHRIPVISTNTGGIPELIKNGTGIIIEEKNPSAIASAIEKLMSDQDYYNFISAQGRKKIEKDFNINTVTENLLKLFAGGRGG